MAVLPREAQQLVIALAPVARVHLECPIAVERLVVDDAAGDLHAGDEGPTIQFVGEVIRPNGRRGGGIGRLNVDQARRFRTALVQRHRHPGLAIKGSDLWVGVAGMREEILDVRNLEFRTRPNEAMDQSRR
jgi:hypothetical protein